MQRQNNSQKYKKPQKDSPNGTVIFLLAFPQEALGAGFWLHDLYTSYSHTPQERYRHRVKWRLSNRHQQ